MRSKQGLWPSGLVGLVTLVLSAAIIVQCLGAAVLIGHYERQIQRTDLGRRIAEQLVVADRILEAEVDDLGAAVASLSTAHLRFELADGPVDSDSTNEPHAVRMRSNILRWEPELAADDLVIGIAERGAPGFARHVEGTFRIGEQRWVRFHTIGAIGGFEPIAATIAWVILVTLMVGGVAAWLVRTLGAPLRTLSNSAEIVGTGVIMPFDEERGPPDIRRLATTLNAMQTRINTLITSRTRALAAVSHDIRTPLARARLRLAGEDLEAERPLIDADLREMDAMLSSLLAFLNEADAEEATTRVNLASLAETVVTDAADMGADVTYEGCDRLDVMIQPFAMKRVLTNLVDNAIKYAGRATVRLESLSDQAVLAVEDEGAGADPETLDRLTDPFFRGDEARARTTDGFGLGLSIAKQVVERHSGVLKLENRSEGGFRASVIMPLEAGNTSSQT